MSYKHKSKFFLYSKLKCIQDGSEFASTWEKSAESFKQHVMATSISTTSSGGCVLAKWVMFRIQKLMQLFLCMNMITSSIKKGRDIERNRGTKLLVHECKGIKKKQQNRYKYYTSSRSWLFIPYTSTIVEWFRNVLLYISWIIYLDLCHCAPKRKLRTPVHVHV